MKRSEINKDAKYQIGQEPVTMAAHNAVSWAKFRRMMRDGPKYYDALVAVSTDNQHGDGSIRAFQWVDDCIINGWLAEVA